MSRSRKYTSITGNCGGSEKEDKRFANRSLRRIVRTVLHKNPEVEILPAVKEVSNPWSFNKDGKHWFGYLKEGRQRRSLFDGQIIDSEDDLDMYLRMMRK